MSPARDPDCLFCQIVAGEIPATIIAQDERTIAFMDINPATRGHALVIPRAHARDVHDIDHRGPRGCRGDGAGGRRAGRRAARRGRREPPELQRVGRLADRLSLPHARHPALRGRPAAAALEARARRHGGHRRRRRASSSSRTARRTRGCALVSAPRVRHIGRMAADRRRGRGGWRLLAASGCGAAIAALVVSAAPAATSKTIVLTDARDDVSGPLDLTRVSLQRASDGRLRAALSFTEKLTPKALLASSGPPGSACVRIWTAEDADPASMRPDRLACVTARSDDEFRGGVYDATGAGAARARRQRVGEDHGERHEHRAALHAELDRPPAALPLRRRVDAARAASARLHRHGAGRRPRAIVPPALDRAGPAPGFSLATTQQTAGSSC